MRLSELSTRRCPTCGGHPTGIEFATPVDGEHLGFTLPRARDDDDDLIPTGPEMQLRCANDHVWAVEENQ